MVYSEQAFQLFLKREEIKEMKKLMLSLVALVLAVPAMAGKIYLNDNKFQATAKVYVTKNRGEAHLFVYIADNAGKAKGKDEVWFFVKNKGVADASVSYIKNKFQADIIVFFVKSAGQAGWKKTNKFRGRLH